MLRRLKILGASESELLDVYDKQIRSVLELAVPAWQPGISKQESHQIERVQRTAFHIVLGENYVSYENALILLKKEMLSDRRIKLCVKFAKKALKNPKFTNWFHPDDTAPPTIKTRANQKKVKSKYKQVQTRTERYEKSPLPYLTKLLNEL